MASAAGPFFEQPLPADVETERVCLGAVLRDAKPVGKSGVPLTYWQLEEVFGKEGAPLYLEPHRRIWKGMVTLAERQTPIDPVNLRLVLTERGDWEAIGGAVYLAKLLDGSIRLENVGHYAEQIAAKARTRAIILATSETQAEAFEGVSSPDELLAHARARLDRVAESIPERVDTSAAAALARLDAKLADPDRRRGVLTGFSRYDQLTFGHHGGDLVYVAADTSIGKTALTLRWMLHAAQNRRRGVIFTLEMPADDIVARVISSEWCIDLQRLRHGRFFKDEYERFAEARAVVRDLPLDIVEAGGWTVEKIRAEIFRLANKYGDLGVLLVDYIGLVRPSRSIGRRTDELAQVSRDLKALALEFDVPVIVPVQLTREAGKEDRDPEIHDLADSASQERDADTVVAIARRRDRDVGDLVVTKQRNGPSGFAARVSVRFWREYARYEEVA